MMILANLLGAMMKFTYKYLTGYFNQFLLLAVRGSILILLNRLMIIYEGFNTHIASKKGINIY